MALEFYSEVLFHLVPTNADALKLLDHPGNKENVSDSAIGKLGLEVGFHIARRRRQRRPYIISTLGPMGDIILIGLAPRPFEVGFQVNPLTGVVLIFTSSKHESDVIKVLSLERDDALLETETYFHSHVIPFGEQMHIGIREHEFDLIWKRQTRDGRLNPNALRKNLVKNVREHFFDLFNHGIQMKPDQTKFRAMYQQWCRKATTEFQERPAREAKDERALLNRDVHGWTYRSMEVESGHRVMVKEIRCRDNTPPLARVRDLLVSELKRLRQNLHVSSIHGDIFYAQRETMTNQMYSLQPNIIEVLSFEETPSFIKVMLPYRNGRLHALARAPDLCPVESLCSMVLYQMLCALCFLTQGQDRFHGDIRPENILYTDMGNKRFRFQLTNFALMNQTPDEARGERNYKAPERADLPRLVGFTAKMDVWSLYATIVAIHPRFKFPFDDPINDFEAVVTFLEGTARLMPELRPMVNRDPATRASAKQMLAAVFNVHNLPANIQDDERDLMPRIPDAPYAQFWGT